MCGNNNYNCGGNWLWIILLILLCCECGGGATNWGGCGNCGNGCSC